MERASKPSEAAAQKPPTTAAEGASQKPAPQVQSTALFRALNPELFIKPNVVTMVVGVLSVSLCVGYIAYWNVSSENRNKKTYMALQENGKLEKREKTSRWD